MGVLHALAQTHQFVLAKILFFHTGSSGATFEAGIAYLTRDWAEMARRSHAALDQDRAGWHHVWDTFHQQHLKALNVDLFDPSP